jgi:imidazolonepropionase-like amidohydrolase
MKKAIYILLLFIFIPTACAGQASGEDAQTIAITHVNLVPMSTEIVLEDQTVLINGTRIAAIGPACEIKTPKDATIIDGTEAYLMPGLADMHMHTTPAWDTEWSISPFILYLANGVTTVRNLDPLPDYGENHPSPDYVLEWLSDIKSGKRPGPTMYTTGLSLQGPNDWRPSVIEAGDAYKVVQENADKGYDLLKIFEYYPKEHFAEAMAAAQEHSMYVTGHIPFEVGLEEAVSGGMDEIAHIVPILYWERLGIHTRGMTRNEFMEKYLQESLAEWDSVDPETWYEREKETIADIVEILRSNKVNICTTGVGPDITKDLVADYDSFVNRVDMQYSRRRFLDLISRGEDGAQAVFTQYPALLEAFLYERTMWLQELQKAGVFLILGTDSGVGMGIVPGFSLHGELHTLIEAGFTPYEAIATGTVHASKVVEEMIGVDDFGTIEVGKRADLILVRENPLEDVANIRNPLGVMAAGRWYCQETLEQMITIED